MHQMKNLGNQRIWGIAEAMIFQKQGEEREGIAGWDMLSDYPEMEKHTIVQWRKWDFSPTCFVSISYRIYAVFVAK